MQSPGANDPFEDITGVPLPDEYSLIRLLGEGSMSHVFLVRNTSLKRLVALKVLRRTLAEDIVSRKRFVREAQAAARIVHASVTSIYTVGTLDNNLPFIEMQYVDGRNLAEVLCGHGRFDAPTTTKILAQLAGALAAAHECRIVHRNVEPTNVMVESDGEKISLSDFGIAGILESGSEAVTKLTRIDDRLGHPKYMSPEQLRGEVLTPQSDIYGLGLLGYELLTLQGPFGDSEVADVARAHIRKLPMDLHQAYPDIPVGLSNILKRCLSKKPESRPTAKDLVEFFSGPTGAQSVVGANDALPLPGALASFLGELQTRKVYKAAATYAALVFIILQVADLVFPPLDIPDWIYRLVVVASLAAFPVVIALAWVFDWHKGRLTRTDEESESLSRRSSHRQRLALLLLGLILSIAVSAAITWWLLRRI